MINKIELPYSLDALEPYYNKETLDIHFNILYANYVENANKVEEDLSKAREINKFDNIKCMFKKWSNNEMASNKKLVPDAKSALDQFKMEAANEVGVNLKNGYNGDLTSRQAGSVGGQMVKKMVEKYENDIKASK